VNLTYEPTREDVLARHGLVGTQTHGTGLRSAFPPCPFAGRNALDILRGHVANSH
jgi:hypothetical protein